MNEVDELELVFWNPHRGNNTARVLDRLDAEIRAGRLDVIVLCEVMRHHDELARWAARTGYWLYHQQPKPRRGSALPSEGDVAMLVDGRNEDLELLKHRRVRMQLQWMVFSHRQLRQPRIYERVWLRTPGGRWKVTGSHWETNGFAGGNARAFAASAASAAAALAARLVGTVTFDVGDHNESVKRLRAWARKVLDRLAVVKGHGPDSVIAVGATVDVEVGPKDGSDHHLIRVTATRRRPRWFRRLRRIRRRKA